VPFLISGKKPNKNNDILNGEGRLLRRGTDSKMKHQGGVAYDDSKIDQPFIINRCPCFVTLRLAGRPT
jgi:hypothetical protein